MKRRSFINNSLKAGTAILIGGMGMPAGSYARIIGANDRVRVGVIGFSDRFRSSLFPSFMNHKDELNYDIVAVCDLWKLRREESNDWFNSKLGHEVRPYPIMMNSIGSKTWMRSSSARQIFNTHCIVPKR